MFATISENVNNEITVVNNKNQLQIITSNEVNLQNYTLYNLSGSIVKSGNENQFSTQQFAKGIYVLKLNLDKGIVTKKINIQ